MAHHGGQGSGLVKRAGQYRYANRQARAYDIVNENDLQYMYADDVCLQGKVIERW